LADLRVLKLALLAETKDFVKGLDSAEKSSKTFSQKLSSSVKKAALAFAALGAAAGAAAIKIGKDAVKAAIEDEQSQKRLATALRNSTNASDAQIKSTEEYITKAQNATGVVDTKLRAAFGNLVRVTKDVTEAQRLNNIALDISAATGKDLEAVSEALSKAYGGNLTALQRLDPSLRDVIKSGGTADEIFQQLSETFGGAAAAQADTFAGRMEIIKRRVEDAQEAIGFALLPVLQRIAEFIADPLVPALEGLVRGLTGGPNSVQASGIRTADGLERFAGTLNENDLAAFDLGTALRDLGKSIKDLFGTIDGVDKEESGFVRFIRVLERIVQFLDNVIDKVEKATAAFQRFRDLAANVPGLGRVPDFLLTPEIRGVIGGQASRQRREGNVTVNIRGAIDSNATARQVVRVLNNAVTSTGLTFAQRAALR
jgi:uncharacterized protein YifE (UPF0438 family)